MPIICRSTDKFYLSKITFNIIFIKALAASYFICSPKKPERQKKPKKLPKQSGKIGGDSVVVIAA